MPIDKSNEKNTADNTLTDEEEQDLRIAVTASKNMIDDGGADLIRTIMKSSKDPGQVIGHFLMQAAGQLSKSLPSNVQLSPRIWLCRGGVLEQISDYIQNDYGIPKQVMDRAEIYVASSIQAQAAQAQQQQADNATQAAPSQPPTPQLPEGAQQNA